MTALRNTRTNAILVPSNLNAVAVCSMAHGLFVTHIPYNRLDR